MASAIQTGRYELLEELGSGAMGRVHRARDPLAGRLVALKQLIGIEADDHVRFQREVQALERLRHRNIVQIFESGELDGTPFLAMELLSGTPLDRLIASGPLPPLDQRLGWVAQVCDGLDYAHWAGVIHRDVKPANLFLTLDGVLKILDFGIARCVATAGATRTGCVLGTVDYMAPEQVQGERQLDGRSDLFSVGVVLYELLFGARPFTAPEPTATLYRIVHHDPWRAEEFDARLGPELGAILRRLLDKDPAARFATGAECAAALREIAPRFFGARGQAVIDALARPCAVPSHTIPLAIPKTPRRSTRLVLWSAGVVAAAGLAGVLLSRRATAPADASAPAALAVPAVAATTPSASAPAALQGQLAVAVLPWARIVAVSRVDGSLRRPLDVTTPALLALPAGRWTLTCEHPQHHGTFALQADVDPTHPTALNGFVPGLDPRGLVAAAPRRGWGRSRRLGGAIAGQSVLLPGALRDALKQVAASGRIAALPAVRDAAHALPGDARAQILLASASHEAWVLGGEHDAALRHEAQQALAVALRLEPALRWDQRALSPKLLALLPEG